MAIENFDEDVLPKGRPSAELERVFVPIYLAHRYQVEAVAKMIGGVDYSYSEIGDDAMDNLPLSPKKQTTALMAVLKTLKPDQLDIPKKIIDLIPPQPPGYERDRELFPSKMGGIFDPISASETYANHSLTFLLNADRLLRIMEHHSIDREHLSLSNYLSAIDQEILYEKPQSGLKELIQENTGILLLKHYFRLAVDERISPLIQLGVRQHLAELLDQKELLKFKSQKIYLDHTYELMTENPKGIELLKPIRIPDGSPIGFEEDHHN